MTHCLEQLEDGTFSFAYAGEKPWHGLGVQVSSDLSPEEIMEKANLNWTVTKVPLFGTLNGSTVHTKAEALVRESDSKVLSIVTDSWNPCQNQEAFEFFNDFIGNGDMEMETAGSLNGGKMVFALARIKAGFNIFGGDEVEGYLLFSNPHSFGNSISIMNVMTRVVCANTLAVAMTESNKHMVKVSHARKFDADEVKTTLGIAHDKLMKYKEMALFLGNKRYKNEDIVDYFNRIFPSSNEKKNEGKPTVPVSRNAKIAMSLVENQPGSEYAEGTWWNAFNAVTFMTNHVIGRSNDNRISSTWYGSNQQKNLKALNLATELAAA